MKKFRDIQLGELDPKLTNLQVDGPRDLCLKLSDYVDARWIEAFVSTLAYYSDDRNLQRVRFLKKHLVINCYPIQLDSELITYLKKIIASANGTYRRGITDKEYSGRANKEAVTEFNKKLGL